MHSTGCIAHDDLVNHLEKFGYIKTLVDGLFVHQTKNIAFTLVVDNFAIKYTNKADADHLIAAIQEK